MIVTAWNNGQHHPSGAGYGLKVNTKDRDKYFRKDWRDVTLELAGRDKGVVVNIAKPSFWGLACSELISKQIGLWLIENGKAPWLKGHPPKMRMEYKGNNRFKVELM